MPARPQGHWAWGSAHARTPSDAHEKQRTIRQPANSKPEPLAPQGCSQVTVMPTRAVHDLNTQARQKGGSAPRSPGASEIQARQSSSPPRRAPGSAVRPSGRQAGERRPPARVPGTQRHGDGGPAREPLSLASKYSHLGLLLDHCLQTLRCAVCLKHFVSDLDVLF